MDDPQEPELVPAILAKRWYWYYVLGLLFLSYVLNTVESQLGAVAAARGIKAELARATRSWGCWAGFRLPSSMPSRISAGHVGGSVQPPQRAGIRRGTWSAMTAACGLAVSFAVLFLAGSAWPSARPGEVRRRTRSSPTTFRRGCGEPLSPSSPSACHWHGRWQTSSRAEPRRVRVATDILARRDPGRAAGAPHPDDSEGTGARLRGSFPQPGRRATASR